MAFFEYDFVGRNSVVRGDRWQRAFRWKVAGVAVDLTGWSGSLTLYAAGGAALLTVPLTLVADGTIAWDVAEADTGALPAGELSYAVALTDAGGRVQTRMRGRVRVL